MENLSLLQPQPINPQIIYVQSPQAQNYQPVSWMEMGLMGHACSFNVQINGQDSVIILHDTQYLAQLVTEGMRLAMNNYLNQAWLNTILQPLAPSVNPQLVHAMRNHWNLPPHFNPIYPHNALMYMLFFMPENLSHLNPIFLP